MPCAASPALSPADSRHRHQRLARAASHGWPIGAKSMVATVLPGLDAQVAQSPLAARVFHFPAAAEGQLLDPGTGVQDELAAAAGADAARPGLRPLFFRPVQQRGGSRGGQVPQDLLQPAGAEPRLALIPAALQHVLDFQPQPAGKAAHVDPLVPQAGIGAGGGELAGLGPAGAPPALAVGVAERRGRHRPPVTAGDRAGIWRRRGRRVVQGRQPAADAGPAGLPHC